ncbi:metal ABC transporter ATP-binding protein [Chthonobacter rhizosphaerae]|uniref:metal ABC transporter ATP-binding protein n=1 Tax=Chthonobacter rhizosphaerae TaxID=2735553 RepID=UPI0015EFB899|nr:metal ABC transporter ATP-binding protein [Chthonobacter rhizosphaerae]
MLKRASVLPEPTSPLDVSAPLSVRNLTVAYQDMPAVSAASVDVQAGSLTAIVGPNGAGKSTLLKAALDLIPRREGRVAFWGRPFKAARRRVAYVPQRAAVDWDFPATALDVVLMGLYAEMGLVRFARRRHKEKARAALARVGMGDLADRQIGRLSGGQQQRVFLARALAQDADLTLLDEPFAGVDAATEAAIVDVLRDLNAAGRTIVAVHHDLGSVTSIFDRVILMAGRVVAAGPTAEVFTPDLLEATYGGRLAVETFPEEGRRP